MLSLGFMYEIIPKATSSTNEFEKPKPKPHVDGVVGSISTPIVESLAKKIH